MVCHSPIIVHYCQGPGTPVILVSKNKLLFLFLGERILFSTPDLWSKSRSQVEPAAGHWPHTHTDTSFVCTPNCHGYTPANRNQFLIFMKNFFNLKTLGKSVKTSGKKFLLLIRWGSLSFCRRCWLLLCCLFSAEINIAPSIKKLWNCESNIFGKLIRYIFLN